MQLPWLTAPLAALTSRWTALVAAVTGALLTFVAAAGVLYVDAAGSAALGYEKGQYCAQLVPPSLEPAFVSGGQAAAIREAAHRIGPRYGFDQVVFAAYTTGGELDINGFPPPVRYGYREGALDHLQVVEGGGRNGLWVPDNVAAATHTRIGQLPQRPPLPPVSAIYRQLHNPLPDWWCSEQGDVITPSMAGDGVKPPVVFLPDLSWLAGYGPVLDVSVRFPVTRLPGTVSEAQDLQRRGDAMLAALRGTLADQGIRTTGGIERFAQPLRAATTARRHVLSLVLPLTAVSLLVGLAGVAALGAQYAQRRRAELWLLWTRGSSPGALGGKAVLELAAPLALGEAAGLLLARLTVGWYAPDTALDPGTGTLAVLVAAAVFAAGLVTLAGTVSWRVHRAFQAVRRAGRARWRWLRLVPWELGTAGLAVVAWTRLARGLVHTSGGAAASAVIDPVALAFPLFVVLTVAGVVVRLFRTALAGSRRRAWWWVPAIQLAMRRLAAAAGAIGGIVLVGVLAIGTLTVGHGIAASERAALVAKSGTLVGANSSVQIATTAVQARTPLPDAVHGNSTVVGFDIGPSRDQIMIVDPATFARAAWIDPGQADRVRHLLGLLAAPGTGGTAPAVRVGPARDGVVRVPDVAPFAPVATVDDFPGMRGNVGYVVAASAVAQPRLVNSWYLWSTTDLATVTGALDRAGISFTDAASIDRALDALPFYTVVWTFGFIRALGAVLAVVAAAALLLAVETRRRQNALSGALAGRMGLRPATLVVSHCAELGAIALLVLVAGGGVGTVGAGVSAPRLDPAPWLLPRPAIPQLAPLLLATAGGAALVVGAAAWIAVRSVRTARVAELIRG
ncbi:ABC transporter permease [Gandjariella thermophila]|uniref:Permease n=1 Tax=Gandjariella thermophila TaxID=1931992 RepID=A0A4D4IXA4_9PSEU|nr:ABC transporter permease [Gandjariella thermophila]GDY28995.1 permease [Gandjariella thermophila]